MTQEKIYKLKETIEQGNKLILKYRNYIEEYESLISQIENMNALLQKELDTQCKDVA